MYIYIYIYLYKSKQEEEECGKFEGKVEMKNGLLPFEFDEKLEQ